VPLASSWNYSDRHVAVLPRWRPAPRTNGRRSRPRTKTINLTIRWYGSAVTYPQHRDLYRL